MEFVAGIYHVTNRLDKRCAWLVVVGAINTVWTSIQENTDDPLVFTYTVKIAQQIIVDNRHTCTLIKEL